MKILAVLALLGFALSSAVPLHPVEYDSEVENAFNEVFLVLKAEEDSFDVVKLKEKFDELVKRVKDAFEQGKTLKDALNKLQRIREKLKDLNSDLGENGREYLDLLKEKIKEYWEKLKEKLSIKRSADIDIFGILEEIKQLIRDHFDPEKIKEILKEVFGKGNELTEHLSKLLKDKDAKQKLLEWITQILGEKESKRSISDIYEKVRDYFRELNIELKEKFVKFGEFVKKGYEKALEKGKTKAESIKRIAKEFLEDSRVMSKDIAADALDFFHEYRKDLGDLYEKIVHKIRENLKS